MDRDPHKTVPCERLYAGVLIGGQSTRMGRPKHLIETDEGQTWLERMVQVLAPHVIQVFILGNGHLPDVLRSCPVLPDAPTAASTGGPICGMRSAMRAVPSADWIFAACDQPYFTAEALHWLLAQRRANDYAVLPLLPGRAVPEPMPAWYSARIAPCMEHLRRPLDVITARADIHTPTVPPHLETAWHNINSQKG